MRAATLSLTLAVCASLAPAVCKAEVVDRVVAVVNDEIITLSELQDLTASLVKQADDVSDPIARDQLRQKHLRLGLDELVSQKLVAQEALKRKLSVANDEVQNHIERVKLQNKWDAGMLETYLATQGIAEPEFRAQIREQLLRNKVLRGVLGERVRVSDGDVEQYYKSKLTELNAQVELDAAHIVLVVDAAASPAQEAAIRQQAIEILERAKAGEDFAALAKQYSQGYGADNGGSLGRIRRGSLDADFEEVAFALPDGGVGGPVRSKLGYHVVRAVTRYKVPAPPYEEAQEEMRRTLTDKRMKDEADKWIQELERKAFIERRL